MPRSAEFIIPNARQAAGAGELVWRANAPYMKVCHGQNHTDDRARHEH